MSRAKGSTTDGVAAKAHLLGRNLSATPRPAYRAIQLYVPDRRPVDVDLSDNTNRWGAHPAALAALRACTDDMLARYPATYADGLKEAIARRFGIEPTAVTTGCGSDDVLDSALRAFCEPGARVAYSAPTFSMIEVFARMNALEPVPVADGTRAVTAETFLAVQPAIVYLCRPNNPTGEVLPRALVEELVAHGDGPVVLLDEAYADFAEDSLLALAPASRRLVVVRTLSKAYGLAGLRIGFAGGAPDLVREIEKSRGPYKVSRAAEAAAVAALDASDGWVEGVIAQVRENRERLARRLEAMGLNPLPSAANFVLIPAPAGADALAAALRARGVAVRPFPALPRIGDAIRVTVAPWPLLERFLEALASALRDSQGEPLP